MDILNKFENINIERENQIPKEDMRYCNMQFDFYNKVYNKYDNHLKTMLSLEDEQKEMQKTSQEFVSYPHTYIWQYSGISSKETEREMVKLSVSFIGEICTYFEKKYNITCSRKDLKYDENCREPKLINIDFMLDACILSSLNGMSFFEKSISEIKSKAKLERNYNEWRKEWNYDIKNKVIKFRVPIYNVIPALYLYDNNETKITDCFNYNKVSDFRSFENGNTDIKFQKSEFALEFARKYLGCVV